MTDLDCHAAIGIVVLAADVGRVVLCELADLFSHLSKNLERMAKKARKMLSNKFGEAGKVARDILLNKSGQGGEVAKDIFSNKSGQGNKVESQILLNTSGEGGKGARKKYHFT